MVVRPAARSAGRDAASALLSAISISSVSGRHPASATPARAKGPSGGSASRTAGASTVRSRAAAQDRKSVVLGRSVSGRVGQGGRRYLYKKKKATKESQKTK